MGYVDSWLDELPLPEGTFCLMLPSESASSKFPKDVHSLVCSGKKSPDPTKSPGKKLVAGRCLQNGRNQFPRGRGWGGAPPPCPLSQPWRQLLKCLLPSRSLSSPNRRTLLGVGEVVDHSPYLSIFSHICQHFFLIN